jgi:hypothetical protein
VCTHLVEVLLSSGFGPRSLYIKVHANLDQTPLGDLDALLPGDENLFSGEEMLL